MPRTTFVCTYENCSSTFQHKEKYENHLRTHSGERPFICTYDNCEKSYRRLSHLKRHEDTHEFTYKCTVSGCARILNSKATLKKHINLVHLNKHPKKYKCSVCNDEFIKHSALQKHSYLHTGIKPFSCPEAGCEKSFLLHCKLKQHLKCHKGYNCEEPNCKKQFPRWSLLVSHRRECHPRILKCEECNKKFSVLSNFKTHCLIHAEEREIFQCPVPNCVRFYQAKHYLSDHLNNFHMKRPLTCSEKNCHMFFKNQEEKNKHVKYRHSPRQRRQKKPKPPRPLFASILAGFEKGNKKELNPQQASDCLEEEPVALTDGKLNSESNMTVRKSSFDKEMSTCSTELLRENNWNCTDQTMGQVLS